MHVLTKAFFIAASTLTLFATTASAEIVCNNGGDCWHAKRSDFKPEYKLQVHPDNWKWSGSEQHKWREHEGHGYWRGNSWINIK
jgi:hypothetical protein